MANAFKTFIPPNPKKSGRQRQAKGFTNIGTTGRVLSVLGGAALAYYGWSRKQSPLGKSLTTAGGYLVLRGASGFCPVNEALHIDTAHSKTEGFEVTSSVTILKPRQEVYQFWRKLENLPKFMQYLEDVRQTGHRRSHWVAKVPKNIISKEKLSTVEWDAEIDREEENSLIAWRSLPGSEIENSGEVRFTDAPANRGTVVQATIAYHPPAGAAGKLAAKLLNPAFKELVKQDLRRFKRLLEAGEIPTIIGQPSGRKNENY
ncbi:YgaP-like transmembrane domain [Pontibacter sp. SGAir0037]|uniref:YgaP-like transmembrane domain n=1 Tax=Pontibacter sp. SGAir0037 TaxID=2571030 RepID=UPI0010CD6A76|nr:YgaP-like transmembrane domain [Pontibacter sp. SGAir0037]QCR21220.1 cyclase [Pontibacter sp. SGAir0037]